MKTNHNLIREINEQKSIILNVFFVFIVFLTIMTICESLIAEFFNVLTGWKSHVITILLASALSSVAAWFILSRRRDFNESLLNSIIESTADGILVVGLTGKVVKANTRFEQMWSIPVQLLEKIDDNELQQFIFEQLINPEDFAKKVQELYNNPESESHDIIKFKDGRVFERFSIPQKSENNIIGRVWNFRDITSHVRTAESRKKIKQIYRAIFEKSTDGIFLMTDVFTECNQAACDLFRCAKDEIICQSPAMFSPLNQPNGKDSVVAAKEKIDLAFQGTPQVFYWQHKRKDNTLFDANVSLNAITIKGEKIIQSVVRDISELNKAEKIRETLFKIAQAAFTASDMPTLYQNIHVAVSELMVTKNFYIAIYDQTNEMIMFPYMVDEYDKPIDFKRHGKGLTEYVLRTGEPCLINKEEDNELRALGEVELMGTPSAIWLGVPLKVEGKTIGVIVVQDYENEATYGDNELQLLVFVSEQVAQAIERKKNAEAIVAYTEELKQLNHTKDKFFSIIAHDLRGPFNATLNLSEIIIEEVESLSRDEIKEYTTDINNALKGQLKLLENLLNWSRLHLGKMEFIKEHVVLNDIAEEIIEVVSGTAKQKQIKVINQTEKNFEVIADINMLRSILQNLISNALKFTKSGGEISVHSKVIDNYARITVSDTGIGLEKKQADSIFQIDSLLTTAGTNGEKGTGLGLSLVKEMVEKHNGQIWVNSTPGKGSDFIFTIPMNHMV